MILHGMAFSDPMIPIIGLMDKISNLGKQLIVFPV